MKILIVAHPDDEILWFNAPSFDHIHIAFLHRNDKSVEKATNGTQGRQRALLKHPLSSRITCWGLVESNYWREETKYSDYLRSYHCVMDRLYSLSKVPSVIYTHNPWGEYISPSDGKVHADHLMINQAVTKYAKQYNIPVFCFDGMYCNGKMRRLAMESVQWEKIDLDFYRQVRDIYIESGGWTWYNDYEPLSEQPYFRLL